ncbi:MAG: molecular chaperone DnaK [Candidatus Diapherotrites archaeon]|nr:molecular chaperone DnaK [Candidatus Diapherotrites archaeon]
MAKEKIIGIDLGTSNSQAAVVIAGRPTIIPSAEGPTVAGKMFPSYVAFTKEGQLLVGEPARRQAVSNPEGTVIGVKRKMGTNHTYKIYGKTYKPQEISAFILQKIKKDAEAFLGEPVKKAVITVPAYFNDNQRTATRDAGRIAGLEVVRLVNEPTAAAMAYGLDKSGEHKILVFDLGGGTLDVTIMEFAEGTYNVISTSGDTQLGGTDMDNAIIDWVIKEFKEKEGIDLRNDSVAMQRIREASEKAKIELSTVLETEINLPYITSDDKGPKHLNLKLTRARLEKLIEPIVNRCLAPIEQALKDAKLKKDDIDKIVLVGGPTRMPIIKEFLEKHVGKKLERGVDPMECVAIGAAIQGAILAGEIKDLVLLDVTPLTLGIETLGNIMTPLIPRNTTIPTKKSQIFTTASDFQNAVTIHILQGERPMAKDNISLGQFNLVGIPPAPRGVPQIEVTFDIDASGILHVSAKDLATGKEQKMTISAPTKLSEREVEEMVKKAKEFEEEDRKKREEAELRNNADALIYTTEKTLADLGDKLTAKQKEKIEKALGEAKDALQGGAVEILKEKVDALQKVLQEAGKAIYEEAAKRYSEEKERQKSEFGESSDTENEKKSKRRKSDDQDDDTIDAEFKVQDE